MSGRAHHGDEIFEIGRHLLGGNDIHNGKTAEQVSADFKDFVAMVHAKLPDTEILFISQNPTIVLWEQRDQETALNDMVKDFAEKTPHLKFIDVSKMVLGDDGKPCGGIIC